MNINRLSCLFTRVMRLGAVPNAGLKYFPPPVDYSGVEMQEKAKLPFLQKVPQYAPNVRPPKMQKKLKLMRGPEMVHNSLLHKQYGIVAITGGRLRFGHLEMMRLTVGRKLDTKRMFALWRIDPPWQPLTKKGQGQRMGKGKGSVDHYVTPIRPGRVVLEVGGQCEFAEIQRWLQDVANKLPFKAEAVSQEIMDAKKQQEAKDASENLNKWTMKYVIQNNLGGCHRWMSPMDIKYFGKYQ